MLLMMLIDVQVRQINPARPVSCLDISQRDMLACTHGCHVDVWRNPFRVDAGNPYLKHSLHGFDISECRFAPFEDALGLGHSAGFSSIIVPGAGEANFDSFEANPFQTSKQRQESEVKALLDKVWNHSSGSMNLPHLSSDTT